MVAMLAALWPASARRPRNRLHFATEPISPTEPLPSNKRYLHFGSGQTETQVDLPPGPHTLQLVLGDANHKPFKPLVASKIIHIRVLRPALSTATRN